SGRITTASTGNPDKLGGAGGAEQVTLTEAQIPAHDHNASCSTDGGHNHAGSVTDVQGNHTHGMPLQTASASAGAATGSDLTAITALSTGTDTTQAGGAHGHNLT